MGYNVLRVPETDEALNQTLARIGHFIDAMYSEKEREIHGPMQFQMSHWLFLWDTGAGFFVERTDEAGNLLSLAMCTKFRDLWSNKIRLEIIRITISEGVTATDDEEINNLVEYLKGISTLLEFEELYVTRLLEQGGEVRELVWQSRYNH